MENMLNIQAEKSFSACMLNLFSIIIILFLFLYLKIIK